MSLVLQPEAIQRFADQQKRLLRRVYDEAWQRGVDGYEPDEDPEDPPQTPWEWASIGLTGAALLALRRAYPYAAPRSPDPVRRLVALAPAFGSANRMTAELASLLGGAGIRITAMGQDFTQAVTDWADQNGWRLDPGAAVAWAGEQAGYGEAANADGQYLYGWMSVGDNRVCPDCEMLSTYPPMALSEWPTAPGSGDTECSYGCRCSWDVWGAPPPADYVPQLSDAQQTLADNLAAQQSQALGDMVGEAAYLE